jgi:tetratricopeptide (TPR) repeat protein
LNTENAAVGACLSSSPRRSFLGGVLFLLAITFGVYNGVFQNGFVDFDDNIYVTENAHTAAGVSPAGFAYAWTTFDSGNWIPLTWLSYQLDVSLFGDHAWAFHLTNLLLHAVNVLFLFGWLLRVTGSYWRSFVVSVLFAVHPLHVESVAWIAERKDVLSAFWLLITLFAYEKYAIRSTTFWYLATCFAFALGLLSKSMLVTLPLLLLLVDFWPLERWNALEFPSEAVRRYRQRPLKWLIIEKIPLILLSLVDGIVTISAQDTGHAVGQQVAGTSLTRLPWSIGLGNAVQAYRWYITKTFWPTGLCVYYPHSFPDINWGQVAVSAILLLGVFVYLAFNGFGRRYLMFGWLWFMVSLGPVIGLLQVGSQAYADRYSYIPHVGLLILIVWEGHFYLQKSKLGRPAAFVATAFVTCGLSFITVSQVAVWNSTDTLWARVLKVDPGNWFAHLQIGNRRVLAGHPDEEALDHFKIVLARRPDHAIALNNVGWIHQCREEWSEAEVYYRRCLSIDGSFQSAIHNLVAVLKKQNRLGNGVELIEVYAQRRPNDAKIQNELGLIYAVRGQMEAAKARFSQAVRVDSNFANARYNLALALAQLGKDQEAESHLRLLLNEYPNHANAHVNLGILLEKSGHLNEARDHYVAALENNPADLETEARLQTLNKSLVRP